MTLIIKKNDIKICIESNISGYNNKKDNIIKVYSNPNIDRNKLISILPILKDVFLLNNCFSTTGENVLANQFLKIYFFNKQNSQEDFNNLLKILNNILRISNENSLVLIKNFNNKELTQKKWEQYFNDILRPQWKKELLFFNKIILNYINNINY